MKREKTGMSHEKQETGYTAGEPGRSHGPGSLRRPKAGGLRTRIRSPRAVAAGLLPFVGLLLFAALLVLPDQVRAQVLERILVDNVVGEVSGSTHNSSNQISQHFSTGANTNGYKLTKVFVGYGDDEGDEFSVRVCTVSGDNQPTSTCTNFTSPTDTYSGPKVQFTHASGMTLAASTTYAVVVTPASGRTVQYLVSGSDDENTGGLPDWNIGDELRELSGGSWEQHSQSHALRIRLKGTLESPPTNSTGAPTVSGVAQAGRTLTAALGTIADQNGLPDKFPDDYTFQWVRVDGANETDISSAISRAYTLTAADVGKTVKVKVSFTDDLGNPEGPLTSAATATVLAARENCTTDRAGADWCTTLTVGVGSQGGFALQGYDGVSGARYGALGDTSIDYGGGVTVEKIGLLVNSVTPADSRVEVELDALVPPGTAFDLGGTTFTADASSRQSTLGRYEWSLPAGMAWREGQRVTVSLNFPPVLRRATVVGAELTLNYDETLDDGSVPATSAYAVDVDGADRAVSSVAIDGTAVTLTLASAVMTGQAVTVSYTVPSANRVQDTAGHAAAALTDKAVTNHTGTINSPAAGQPTISGVAQVGETLVSDISGITDTDGLTGASYSYQWIRVKEGGKVVRDIPGATSDTYTLAQLDLARAIKLRVSFTDDNGNPETVTSDIYPLDTPYTNSGDPAPVVMRAQTSCPAADDWCATMTVGTEPPPFLPRGSIRGLGMEGYDYFAVINYAVDPKYGEMDDYRPTLDGVTYTINRLVVQLTDGWNFGIYTTPILPYGTRLTLNGLTFTTNKGLPDQGDDGYRWEPPPYRFDQLAWVENQKVTVSLRSRENHEAVGRPGISGRQRLGVELQAVTGGIADANGLEHVEWSYQWVLVDGETETDIPGATESVYVPGDSDEGKRVKVRVSFNDDHGFDEVRESEPTAFLLGPLPDASTLLDTTLLVAENVSLKGCFDYGPSSEHCSNRLGEDTFTSTHPRTGDLTLTISSLILKTLQSYDLFLYFDKNLRGYERENLALLLDGRVFHFTSASDRTPIARGEFWTKIPRLTWSEGQEVRLRIKDTYRNRLPTGRPSISGGNRVGDTLSAGVGTIVDADGLPDTLSWQWIRVDDGAESDIAGATSGSYTLTADDYGKNVKVRVSFTDRHNNAEGPLVSDIFPEAGDFVLAAPSGVALNTTLNVGDIPNGYFFGCSDGSHHCYRNLGRAYFQYRGREHRIRALYDNDGYNLDQLVLRVEWPDASAPWDPRPDIPSLPGDNGMFLGLDERQFDIADSKRATGSVRYWDGDGLDWDDGDRVRVRICDGRCPREVTPHDAQATEGEDTSLEFTVTMYPPSDSAVTMRYETSDLTATAGDDYEETSGTLIFAPGETEKTISVPIIDDAIEDSREQVRLMLGIPSNAVLGRGGQAIGTIYNDEAEAEADEKVLTASFLGMPETHNGSTAFSFRLKLSDDIKQGTEEDLEEALSLSGADVKHVVRVDERYDLFEFTLEPTGNEDVTISLGPSTTDCTADGAVCTADETPLTGTITATVTHDPGPGIRVSDAEATEGTDASLDFVVTLTETSSKLVTVDYATSDDTATAGSDYTAVSSRLVFRAGETSKTISVAIENDDVSEPDGETVKLTLSNTGHAHIIDGEAVGTIKDAAGDDADQTSEELDGLTAEFQQIPASHDGAARFTVQVKFSEELAEGSGRKLRRALSVSGGSSKSVRKVGDARDLYVVTFEPTGDNSVTMSLGPSAADCTANDAICTSDDEPLQGTITTRVPGPTPGIRASDAEATEGTDASLDFVVTLNKVPSSAVTVDYATSDGTATAGSDYTAASDTLTFAVGERSKTISVAIETDEVSEPDGETVKLTLSNPSGAEIFDGDAVGTIRDATGTDTDETSEESDGFTAAFQQVPASHDGEATFTFRLKFSEEIKQGTKRNLFRALERTGANLTQVLRVDDRLDLFELTFEPTGDGDIAVSLGPSTTDCTASDAICTDDDTPLTGTINATISGPSTEAPRANEAATGSPTITGTAQVGETLTAVTTGISDADGLTDVSYTYQWIQNNGTEDAEISGATGATYTLVDADQGKTIKVKVSFTDDAGHSETLTSAATGTIAARPNRAATGSPTITGTAQVGETLTAVTTGISDADGLTDVSYTYQWIRNNGTDDADISGATGGTYTLATDDRGKTIKVKVSFTDDAGHSEELTSAATGTVAAGENNAATGAPTISGTAQVGQTLTASTTGISDPDGLTNVSYSYQWLRDSGTGYAEISGATRSTFTLARVNRGKTLKVRVRFTDNAGHSEELTSAATGRVAASGNNAPTGAPTISGTAQVGQTLTANTSGISDADGLDDVSYSYQWIRNDGTDDSDIADATSSTYTLTDEDEGKKIKVKVSFTDDEDNDESLTSAATASVAARPNSAATGAPTISGAAKVGETLTAGTSGIADADGLDDVSYSYQWIRNNGTSDSEIEGATGSTLFVLAAWEGETIKVQVSFTDDAGHSESLTSAATEAVTLSAQAQQSNNEATGAPTISGTAQVGQTLTASTSGISDADGLDDVSYSYQWIRNDGTNDSEISGATSSTYTLMGDDQGKKIKVKVSFTDDEGNDESLTSAATATVAARPNSAATGAPTISGTVQVGQTLTASTSGISDADGLDDVSYSYQWIRNDGTNDSEISGATSSTYTLMGDDQGKKIKVKVSFTDDEGNDESLTSAATASVAPPPFTAEFLAIPTSHDGEASFTIRLKFSEAIKQGTKRNLWRALTRTGADMKQVLRVNDRLDLFELTFEPKGNDDVTVTLGPSTTDCTARDAICTDEGTALTGTITATISGPSG